LLPQPAITMIEPIRAIQCKRSGANVGGMDAVVFDPPQGLSLLTLYLATSTESGHVGNILIEVLHGYDTVASFQLTVPREG
jgi:hypothetical protein